MLGSISYFSQFCPTMRRTTSTYQAYIFPKSPPPEKLMPPAIFCAVKTLYEPAIGPPSPYGTVLSSGGGCRGVSCEVFGCGLGFFCFSGIGKACGVSSTALGSDCVSPCDWFASTFCVCTGGAGKGMVARLTSVALIADPKLSPWPQVAPVPAPTNTA